MKRLKVISVLLSVTMCMSLITTPVSVLAEDSAAPSESQSVEPAEPKESETTEEKETKPSSDKKPRPSTEKETTSETSITESDKETESPEPSNETSETKATNPSEAENKKTNEAKISEATGSDKKAPAESEDRVNAPEESGETSVIEGKIPSQSDSNPKKNAVSGTCGVNLTWTFEEGTLTISGSGKMGDYTYMAVPWYSLKDSISSVVFSGKISSIGMQAFSNCSNLTNITIPDSVTSIGNCAFYMCNNLSSITIPQSVISIGVSAFEDCKGLTSLTISEGVNFIGDEAFNGCENLSSVKIPSSVTSIGNNAFYNCFELSSIEISYGVTTIGNYSFRGCRELTSITIPNSVTSIGNNAFESCFKLSSIVIPNSVTSIGSSAFNDCMKLNNVTIPDGLTSINNSVFSCCSSLISIKIPNSVTEIGDYAFWGCSNLTSITIPNSVTSIGEEAFRGCAKLTRIIIPNGVSSINNYTFDSCNSLTSITIPKSVTSIWYNAFDNCASLKDVFYSGTEDDWNKIRIADDNDYLINAIIHFNCNDYSGEISFENENVILAKGKRITLKTTGANDIAYKTSNKKIATVSTKGVVTALKIGEVTITAYSKSDPSKNANCTVIVRYKLTYVLNGGTNSDENPEFYTGTIKLKNPTRQYYTFKGWYTDKKFKNKVTSVKNVNKTIYAKWALNSYSIKFIANGGSGKMSSQTCSVTKEYKLTPNKFTKKGYSFTGWNTKADGSGTLYSNSLSFVNLTTTNGETIVLYAQWSINTYTINYQGLLEGTNNDNVKNYTVNTPTFNLNSPSCVYHKFLGWYSDAKFKNKVTRITKGSTGNKTFYAKWALDSYTIKFNSNGGTGKMDPQKCSVTKEYTLNANKFSKKGYSFDGWNTKADGTGTFYSKDLIFSNLSFTDGDTINLYAQWKINNYIITYKDFPDTEKTTNDNKTSYTIKTDTFTFKPASCPGYVFKGWYSDSKHKKSITKIAKGSTGNKTIYSKWTANKYTIKFDANGGTGKMNPMEDRVYGKEFPLTKNTFTAPEGKVFSCWNTKEDGSGTSYANCAKVKNLTADKDGKVTLFAQWKPIFTMRLSLDGFEIYKNKANGILRVDWPNCTVYALGRAYEILEKIGNNIRTRADGNLSFIVPGHSSAKYWLENNASSGNPYPTGGPEEPRVGAIAVWSSKDNGHVAIVEHIDPDGTVYYSHSVFGGFNPATWAQEPKYYPGSDNNFYFHCEAQYDNGVRKWGYDENGVPDQLLGYIYLI